MTGIYFRSHTYEEAGNTQYITIVALENDTKVHIQKPDTVEGFGVAEPQSNVQTFDLNALDSVRFKEVSITPN